MKNVKRWMRKIIKNNSASKHQKLLLKEWKRNGNYLEIGVWKGNFSMSIQKVCTPNELHLLDPWEFQPKFKHRMFGGAVAKDQEGMNKIYNYVKSRFSLYPNVVFHRGFSSDLHSNFNDEFFDAIYIDGNHYFTFVLEDLNNYWRKVKVGGLITGDDYFWSATELNGELPVKNAVAQFLEEKKEFLKFEKLIGDQFVIRRTA